MKTLILLLFLMVPSFAFAQGSEGTGGGNAIGSNNSDRIQMKLLIENSKRPLVFVFRRLEIFSQNGRAADSPQAPDSVPIWTAAKKIFAGSKTIYDVIREAKFVFPSGPCFDSVRNERDASAVDAPTFCFSVDRLAKHITSDAMQMELMALIAHELSHALGTDEVEATMIQWMVKDSIANKPFEKIPELVKIFKQDLEEAIYHAESVKEIIVSMSPLAVCSGLGGIHPKAEELMQANTDSMSDRGKNGISFLNSKGMSEMMAVTFKAINLLPFCVGETPDSAMLRKAFQGKPSIDLTELARSFNKDAKFDIEFPKMQVRQVRQGDMKALEAELADIITLYKSIQKSL
jgi:hypothetical protein